MNRAAKLKGKQALIALLTLVMILTSFMTGWTPTTRVQAASVKTPVLTTEDGTAVNIVAETNSYGQFDKFRVEVPEGTTTLVIHRDDGEWAVYDGDTLEKLVEKGTGEASFTIPASGQLNFNDPDGWGRKAYIEYIAAETPDPDPEPTGGSVVVSVETEDGFWVEPTQLDYSDSISTYSGLLDTVLGSGNM